MICRQWRGLAKSTHAQDYIDHLRSETLPQLARIPGFVDASILRRNAEREVEFLIVTRWQSMAAIEQFAGEDPSVAVVPPKVQAMMIDFDRTVRHYEIVE